ncbi:MAG TPA: thioesterase family protein [Candidatus Eisenbacteria bacterium]|nr:thioesterase family protein [Candidatus Eisenbacteria bacterium]
MPVKNTCSYRVIYGDTDQMGVVYYANYLRWFEKGRSELLRQIGLPYAEIEAGGLHFPVIEVTCRYRQPARYDDTITIETELTELGRASLSFHYRIHRENTLAAEGSTKHACTTSDGRVMRIPDELAKRLRGEDNSNRPSRSNP